MTYALFGLLLSDRIERAYGLEPTEEDKKNLQQAMPKVQLVDRDEK